MQRVQRALEGVLAHRVVRDVDAAPAVISFTRAATSSPGRGWVLAAVGLHELRLLLRADGADHVRAERVEPLAHEETHAAGGGVHEVQSPFFTGYVRRTRYSTVHPLSMIAAAVSSSMLSGSAKSLSAAARALAVRAERAVEQVRDALAGREVADAGSPRAPPRRPPRLPA
jgi:hypothetical protein